MRMLFLQNGLLEFARVVKAREQVVAGTLHHLTIEAVDAGKKKLYEAKVWVKPWMNFKELQEFKHAGDVPSFTPADLGARRGECCFLRRRAIFFSIAVRSRAVRCVVDGCVKLFLL